MKIKISVVLLFSSIMYGQNAIKAPSQSVKEVYFGKEIVDEYRNIENLKDSTVLNWLKAETNLTKATLSSISGRNDFFNRLLKIDDKLDFVYFGYKEIENVGVFYLKESVKEKTTKLFFRKNLESEEVLLFEPSSFKQNENKEHVISYFNPSTDGSKVAIALTEGGKEVSEIVIYDVINKKVLPDVITNNWAAELGGIFWLKDNLSFIYIHIPNIDNKHPEFIKNTQSVIYKIGDNSLEHKDVFSRSNNPECDIKSEDFPIISYINKSNNLIFGITAGATPYSDTYYSKANDVKEGKLIWKKLYSKENNIKEFVIDKDNFIYITEINGQSIICKTLLSNANFNKPDIVFESIKDEIINSIVKVKEGFYFTTLKNGISAKLYFYNNKVNEITLPFLSGKIMISNIDENSNELIVYCSGWTKKKKRFKYVFGENIFKEADLNKDISLVNTDEIVVEEIEIKTHDGLDLPLTIIYKKGLKKNSKNRVYMTGYGSYGSSYKPFFSPYSLLWVEDGGILVYTHVRGGGEKGDIWHKGGFKETKPNTWKDFISSAEYLIEKKYTLPKFIGITGGSAGGILIGRAITERPDLFKAAIIDVGILNPLRFEHTPNGQNNVKEFGSVKIENEFNALYEMDSYHHIQMGVDYPATLVTTGINDSRVIAWIPAKFAAKLKAYNFGKNPIFLSVDFNGGHSGNDSIDNFHGSLADEFAFFYWQLGDKNYKLKN
ncbi:S9 family peptidase [Flavobacterium sp. F372]|uniref:prolyl oligopeptidase n=1 Tax=Flavobacterium bernardetii TaxID=2813823 RepID=A0ABR7IZN5_9FLAO|nr:prolyl oligopeptidase family serine peptidase [Flavobacterium bernardetii]MBC5835244.1 S9 family peptidase [Flavobacterium bernardetii]NHF71367.1 S9 family peptidase [Flavobacterium bernardetii]